jgi:pantoate kinase
VKSGLANGRTLEAMNAASEHGMASMSMLGNSVFAVGDIDALEKILSGFGNTFRCSVDLKGPVILHR